ncbi:MAG: lipid-A-disaccharide synthase [Pyrinomonadaceae bacterium]
MTDPLQIMIVAGEASGDLHGAKLVTALRDEITPSQAEFFGCAGPRMREAGVEAIVQADSLAIVGLPEIAKALPVFLKAFGALKRSALGRRPDVVILVDFPEFNLKLARSLKRIGCRVVYYISPQLWAWRKYRIGTIRNDVDLLITILPFEKAWYAEQGLDHVEFVGSPLAKEVHAETSKAAFLEEFESDPSRPIVALLPGSRRKEIDKIFPIMLAAAARISKDQPEIQFIAALGSPATRSQAAQLIDRLKTTGNAPSDLIIIEGRTYDALNASDAAAVTSGTATLEAGILGTPMAIVYKTSRLNYKLMRPLISVPHFGLINLIAEKRIAKELIQDEFTPETLADEILRILAPEENAKMRGELRTAAEKLGRGGASKRAAQAILGLLGR